MKEYYCPCGFNFDNPYQQYNYIYRESTSDDDYEGYEDDMAIYEQNVAKVMNLINTRYANLSRELISSGMSAGGVRYLFRYIVYYTISNANRYPGNESQKANSIFNALRSLEPWVFSSFASTYLPAPRIDYIIMTIIMFTLRNVSTPVAP